MRYISLLTDAQLDNILEVVHNAHHSPLPVITLITSHATHLSHLNWNVVWKIGIGSEVRLHQSDTNEEGIDTNEDPPSKPDSNSNEIQATFNHFLSFHYTLIHNSDQFPVRARCFYQCKDGDSTGFSPQICWIFSSGKSRKTREISCTFRKKSGKKYLIFPSVFSSKMAF